MKRGNKDVINIQVTQETHEWLKSLKIIERETFDEVLLRIKEHWSPDNIRYENNTGED